MKFEASRHFLLKNVCDSSVAILASKAHLSSVNFSFRSDSLPNMSSSSALTSCSPYWLSSVFHKQARLHFKGDDLCPVKRMNEEPYLCRSELRSAARCYFGLTQSTILNSTHDYYYHGSFAATNRRGVLIYSCDHCKTCYKIWQVVKITCFDHMG